MNCRICGSRKTEIWKDKKAVYSFCRNCGIIQTIPRFFPEAEKEKERYLKHNNTASDSGYVEYLEKFIFSSVLPYTAKGDRILDFGSGPEPVLTALLNSRGFDTIPYDIYFAPDKNWKTKTFDAAVSVEVFEHLKDPAAVLESIWSVLKPDGILIIRTLLHNENKSEFMGWWYREDFTHITFYSEKSFKLLAGISGFKIIDIKERSEIIMIKTS